MDENANQSSASSQVTGLMTLLRPLQWVKNDFVLVPLMFTRGFVDSLRVYYRSLAQPL